MLKYFENGSNWTLSINMTKIFKNDSLNSEKLNWSLIQNEIKNKLGQDIYDSWLKKITFVEEFHNYICYPYQLDLFVIGLHLDI